MMNTVADAVLVPSTVAHARVKIVCAVIGPEDGECAVAQVPAVAHESTEVDAFVTVQLVTPVALQKIVEEFPDCTLVGLALIESVGFITVTCIDFEQPPVLHCIL